MSIAIAVGAGLCSALAYGTATAAQHAAAYTGEVDAGRLKDLLRNRRWLLGTAGDVLAIVLQLIALGNGPVVLVQPLLVLCLPVAVLLRSRFGAPPPSRRNLADCALLVLAVGAFFVLIGSPHRGRIIDTHAAAWISLAALGLGGIAIAAVHRRPPIPRAAMFGAVAGCWFGLVSVLIEAVASLWERLGLKAFGHPEGWVPLVALIVLAVAGYLLVQIGFQLGPLAASFPPNLILDPVVAVVLGAVLLNERVPSGPPHLLGYLACLGVVGWAVLRLADPTSGPGHPAAVG
ncbi:MAG TPA: DMT family transporter [Jatrophihabitans sp.]